MFGGRKTRCGVKFCLLAGFLLLGTFAQAQIYVNGLLGDDAFDGSAPLPGVPPIGPKKTINAGVGATTDSHTLYIASDTYTENVVLNKSIIMGGDSRAGVIAQSPSGATINVSAPGCRITTMTISHAAGGVGIQIDGQAGASLSNCSFTGPNVAIDLGLSGGSDSTRVSNCSFSGCQAIRSGRNHDLTFLNSTCDESTSHGLSFRYGTGLTLQNVLFSKSALSSIFLERTSNVLIEGCEITEACYDISSASAVGNEFGAITYIGDRSTTPTPDTGLTIRNNLISDTVANYDKFNSYVPGTSYRTGALGFDYIPHNCLIEDNTFQDNQDGGIQINRRLPGITGFECHYNNFSNNEGKGFMVNSDYNNVPQPNNFVRADLSSNYWGAASGPKNDTNNPGGAGAEIKPGQVGDLFDFSPWMSTPVGSSPQTWYVLRLSGIPDSETTINEALGNSGSGDTIFVRPGTYNEAIDISQSLTLKSTAGRAVTVIDGTGTARPLTSGLDIPIYVQPSSDDLVSIQGFNITNSFIGVKMKDIGGHTNDKLSVYYCLFDNIDSNGAAVVVEYSQADIRHNLIEGNGAGIRLANASHCLVAVNIIRNGLNYGISVAEEDIGGLGAFTCENIMILNNKITNLTSLNFINAAYGIFLGRTDGSGIPPLCKNVTVSDNTITTCGHTGIIFDAQNEVGDGVLLITDNTISDCGRFGGVSADGIWSLGGIGNNYGVTISGNTIQDNTDTGILVNDGQLKIQENNVTNNGTGVVVSGGIVDLGGGPYGSAGLNHIEYNSTLNLHNTSPNDMKAEMNWWGSVVFNNVELTIDHKPDNALEGFVDFIPFKGMTDPDPVWVDELYSKLTIGWGYSHFDNLHDGTHAVATCGDVIVSDGIYDYEESYPVVIPKCETVYGASRAGTIIRDPSSVVDSQAKTGAILFDVYGANVTIANMTFDGDNDPSTADDASIPERGHGDSLPDNDVNALAGIRFNPPDATSTAFNLFIENVLFKNLYRGASISGRPGSAGEISIGNVVEECVFHNIGARDKVFKDGAGVYFTSAELEVSSNTFTLCDMGLAGVIDPLSAGVSALSAHDNNFTDNYYGVFLDGSQNVDSLAGMTTFDPDGAATITEGISDNIFTTTEAFRNDIDVWDPLAGDFIDHQNLDASTTDTFADPTPPTMFPDTPVGFFIIGATDPVMVADNHFLDLRRGAMVLSQRGALNDDGTVTLLHNRYIGPGSDPNFDATSILALNRQFYGDADADDDFGGDVKMNVYDSYIEGAVDLIRLQEEPVLSLDPSTFYIEVGGSIANRNVFGLTRDQAINLGFFNLPGGGMLDDVDATYNDFLVNRFDLVEQVVYHEYDESYLGLVTFLPARRLAYNVSLTADPEIVENYDVYVDLTASVTDGFGDSIGDGIPVLFATDFGLLGTTDPVFTFGGEAQNTLLSNVDGTANVTATVDSIATGTTTVIFDVTDMEFLYYYPFDDPDLEGWEVGLPPPGTFIDAKDGAFYMAPTTQPTGQIGVIDKFPVNLFGYWHLKDEFAIDYLSGKLYRARYRIRTSQTDQNKVPLTRMRWNNIRNYCAASQRLDKGPSAPLEASWTDYYSYFLPPDLSSLPPEDQGLILSFDLVDFTDTQSGSLFLDEVEVVRFNPPIRQVATSVVSYDSQADFSSWTNVSAPTVFGIVTAGSDASGLYLESGAAPSPPAGKEGLPDFGAWELPMQDSPVSYESDKLYRAVFTLQTPDLATQQTISRIRLRLQNGSVDWNNVYELFQRGAGEYYGHLPAPGGSQYSVFMESPLNLYPTGEAAKNNITLAFDVVDGNSYEQGRVYLTNIEIEYYSIP